MRVELISAVLNLPCGRALGIACPMGAHVVGFWAAAVVLRSAILSLSILGCVFDGGHGSGDSSRQEDDLAGPSVRSWGQSGGACLIQDATWASLPVDPDCGRNMQYSSRPGRCGMQWSACLPARGRAL